MSGVSLGTIRLPVAYWKTVETDVVRLRLSPRGLVPVLAVEKWLPLLRLIHWKRLKRISPWNSQLSCRSRRRRWRCSLCPVGLKSLGLLLVPKLGFLRCEFSFHRRSYLQFRCSDIRLPFSNRQEMNQLCVCFWRVLNFLFNSETMLKDSESFRSKALDSSFSSSSNNYTLNSYWTRLLSDLIFLLISSRYTQTARPLTARRKF